MTADLGRPPTGDAGNHSVRKTVLWHAVAGSVKNSLRNTAGSDLSDSLQGTFAVTLGGASDPDAIKGTLAVTLGGASDPDALKGTLAVTLGGASGPDALKGSLAVTLRGASGPDALVSNGLQATTS